MDFKRAGLKTGVKTDIFWSEIGSRFGEPGSTPPPIIPRSIPGGKNLLQKHDKQLSFI